MILNDTVTLGFGHFLAQSDFVSRTLLAILLLMSVVSWALIVSKGISQLLRRARSERFLQMFWNASSLQAVQHEITTHGVRDPFAHLTGCTRKSIMPATGPLNWKRPVPRRTS